MNPQKQEAFSLLEVLLVIALLSILIAFTSKSSLCSDQNNKSTKVANCSLQLLCSKVDQLNKLFPSKCYALGRSSSNIPRIQYAILSKSSNQKDWTLEEEVPLNNNPLISMSSANYQLYYNPSE